jgi:outer membrane protein assembly factor BamB
LTIRLSRRWASIAVIVLMAGALTACGGPAAPTSWSGLTVSGQTAYLAATDHIYALDVNPLTNDLQRQKWTFPAAEERVAATFHSQPVVSESGIVYAGSDGLSGQGFLFAFDAATGASKWIYPSGESAAPLGSVFGAVAYDGQSIFAGTNDGRVVSVDAESGLLNWTYPATTTSALGRIWSSPVVSGSVVYLTSQDHNLYALNAASGEPAWEQPFKAGAVLAGAPTVYGNTVYAGSFDQKLYAIDAATGAKKWEFAAQGWLWEGPAVFDDVLYFGDLSGHLYAVRLDGTPLWSEPRKLDGMIRARPLVTEDRIYVATGARKLFAINRATLADDWPQPFTTPNDGESLLTTPVLAGDLALVAPLPSGGSPVRLYAVNTVSGNLEWQFPAPTAQ